MFSVLILNQNTSYGQCYTNGSGTYLSGETYIYNNEFAGSQFLADNWQSGDVFLLTGDVIKNQLIRYNIYSDDLIWFETSSNAFVKLDKGLISGFNMHLKDTGSTIHFVKVNLKEEQSELKSSIFLQRLLAGDISVLAHRKVVQTGRTESVFIAGKAHQRLLLLPSNKYYISFNGGRLISISLSKKSLINTIAAEFDNIDKTELRRKLFRITNEKDLINAIPIISSFIND